MEITFNLKSLKQSLNFLQKAIPSKPQLPILSAILLETLDNKVILSATDLFLGIQTHLPAQIAQPGKIAIPGEIFRQIIQSLDDKNEVKLKLVDNQILITSGKTRTKLPLQPAQDYPEFPDISGDELTLTTQALEKIEHYVSFTASIDQTRPILTSILFSINNQTLTTVATDGFRLAILKQACEINVAENKLQKFLLPAKALAEIVKVTQQLDLEKIKLTISEELKQIKCQLVDTVMYIRLIEGEFPPYEKIMPDNFGINTRIDASDLDLQLKRAAIFSRDISNIVKFTFKDKQLQINASSPTIGSYEGEVDIMDPIETEQTIAFNVRYISDFIQASKTDLLKFSMNESLKPAALTTDELKDFIYIVMPFRVNN